jgi:hypothetical protein
MFIQWSSLQKSVSKFTPKLLICPNLIFAEKAWAYPGGASYSDQHCRFLQYGINYVRKKFYFVRVTSLNIQRRRWKSAIHFLLLAMYNKTFYGYNYLTLPQI